eukprot:3958514-Amphidinium_carterae.3
MPAQHGWVSQSSGRIAKERQAIRAKEPEEPAMFTVKSQSVPASPPGRSRSAPVARHEPHGIVNSRLKCLTLPREVP